MRNFTPRRSSPGSLAAQYKKEDRHSLIEWEEVPSLADQLKIRLINPAVPAQGRPIVPSVLGDWQPTMPLNFDDSLPSMFEEVFEGLSIREIHEPDLFQHFFGESKVKT